MRTSKLLGVVCGGLFALTIGAQQAGATATPPSGVSQFGMNQNRTTHEAESQASTTQKNFNVPLSFLSFGANNGDVQQSNDARTSAKSTNENATWQQQDQHQTVRPEHKKVRSEQKDAGGAKDRHQPSPAAITVTVKSPEAMSAARAKAPTAPCRSGVATTTTRHKKPSPRRRRSRST